MNGRHIRATILGFWLGVMAYFSFIVAPVAFSVLPAQHLAGNVVSANLAATEFIGMAFGLVLLAIALRGGSRFELAALVLMTAAMAVSRFFVSKRLHSIRLQYGDGIAALAANDPTKQTFDLLHRVSVGLMTFAMVAAMILIVLLLRPAKQDG